MYRIALGGAPKVIRTPTSRVGSKTRMEILDLYFALCHASDRVTESFYFFLRPKNGINRLGFATKAEEGLLDRAKAAVQISDQTFDGWVRHHRLRDHGALHR
jgi:hypothetical protein